MKTDGKTIKTVNKKNTHQTNVKKDNEIKVETWDELKHNITALNEATEDTTIILDGESFINTESSTWSNNKMVLTIDGNGYTINGNGAQLFYIDIGSSLVLKNITITNAKSENGGAIYNHNGNLTVINCTLYNNSATSYGGAIFTNGTLNISDSTLYNNTAKEGGAIFNRHTLTVQDCEFNNNTTESGGAISTFFLDVMNSVTHISNSNFTDNYAYIRGGAIYSRTLLNVTDCTFTHNTAENNETIDLNSWLAKEVCGNSYVSTDI